MGKKLFLILLSSFVLAMVGCSGGDDGGADPKVPLNDPNSKDQPTSVTGAGGGGNTGATTQKPSTE